MSQAYLQRIASAVPDHDIHEPFVGFAQRMLSDRRASVIFQRLASKSGIRHRYCCLPVEMFLRSGASEDFKAYGNGHFPSTGDRMKLFEKWAPVLARKTLDRLQVGADERKRIRHVLVTCCTGFYAPGLDYDVVDYLGLPNSTERIIIGFMGCYAAINALKLARHLVRSEPDALALVVNLELCTLHFHETQDLNEAAAFLLFGDGCTASLVGAEPRGFALDAFEAMRVNNSTDLITWRVGDLGFDMFLSGQVPSEIAKALREKKAFFEGDDPKELWAVHPGGRAILDAVENGLDLPPQALEASRQVLQCFGNMSSPSVMFVLEKLMKSAVSGQRGCAISFGPGLTAETMQFHAA